MTPTLWIRNERRDASRIDDVLLRCGTPSATKASVSQGERLRRGT